jgi:tetratricopeptide (TPR) repeat protein
MNLRPFVTVVLFYLFFLGLTPINAQEAVNESEQLDFAQGLLSRGMYDMAILQCRKFIAEFPRSASLQEAYLSLGEGYFLYQDFKKAADTFKQFQQLYPDSDKLPVCVLRLGQIDIRQKRYDEALKELTSIDVQEKLKGEMLQSFNFYTAQAYLGKADTPSALEYFQKAAQVQGAFAYTAYAFKEIGQIHAQNGHYSEGMQAYAKAMQLTKEDSLRGELTYRIAEAQFLSGQYADAIKGFGQVLDQYSGLGFTQEAMANLLLAYFNSGHYNQLLKIYQQKSKLFKDDGDYFSIHYTAVLAYIELKEYDQANELLNRVLAFPTLKLQERAKILFKKADILIRQKKYKDGLALLQAYSSEDKNDTDEIFFSQAQAYFGLGDFDRAFDFFGKVYLNFPGSRFSKAALLGQAHARQEMGEFKDSNVLYLKYYNIQDDPQLKSEALFDAVVMADKAGDVKVAISSSLEYLKVFPKGGQYGEVLLILADQYGKNNQPQEAINLLKGYLAKLPSVQRPNSAYFLLGFNEQLLGRSDRALAAYKQVDPRKEGGKFYSSALKNSAIIYLGRKNIVQARAIFERLINQTDLNDLQTATYIWVCNEYLKEQKYDDVLRIAALAEKQFPPTELLEIKYFKAEALRGLDRCEEALKIYDLVTASPQKNTYTGSARIGDGLCLAGIKKFDEAKQEFQKSLDENPNDYTITVHARFEMAKLEAAQGHIVEALKFYLLIANIYDDSYYCSESLLRAGKIFERLRRKADALKMYSEILDKYKNSRAAIDAKGRVPLLK